MHVTCSFMPKYCQYNIFKGSYASQTKQFSSECGLPCCLSVEYLSIQYIRLLCVLKSQKHNSQFISWKLSALHSNFPNQVAIYCTCSTPIFHANKLPYYTCLPKSTLEIFPPSQSLFFFWWVRFIFKMPSLGSGEMFEFDFEK